MKEFRVTVEPARRFIQDPAIDATDLARLLPNMKIVALNQLQLGQHGRYFLNLNCGDVDNERIINDVLFALQELGYSVIEAKLVDIVSGVLEGLFVGGLSGLGASVKAKDPKVTLAISCLGMAIGTWFGLNTTWEKTSYGLDWNPAEGWKLAPIRTQRWPSRKQFFDPIRKIAR